MMRDKQYQFNLTEKQIDTINELIKKEFQNEVINNKEELMSLLSYINLELGFQKGSEEFRGDKMMTKIKIIFKDNTECVFNANTHIIDDDNYDYDFYRLGLIDEKGNHKFVALVSIPDIKVISYIESEMDEEIEDDD